MNGKDKFHRCNHFGHVVRKKILPEFLNLVKGRTVGDCKEAGEIVDVTLGKVIASIKDFFPECFQNRECRKDRVRKGGNVNRKTRKQYMKAKNKMEQPEKPKNPACSFYGKPPNVKKTPSCTDDQYQELAIIIKKLRDHVKHMRNAAVPLLGVEARDLASLYSYLGDGCDPVVSLVSCVDLESKWNEWLKDGEDVLAFAKLYIYTHKSLKKSLARQKQYLKKWRFESFQEKMKNFKSLMTSNPAKAWKNFDKVGKSRQRSKNPISMKDWHKHWQNCFDTMGVNPDFCDLQNAHAKDQLDKIMNISWDEQLFAVDASDEDSANRIELLQALMAPISKIEYRTALRKLNGNSAPGRDGVTGKVLKKTGK